MFRVSVFIMLLFFSCNVPNQHLSYNTNTKPLYDFDTEPQKILFINGCDIASKHFRDNKEALFTDLVKTLMNWAIDNIRSKTKITAEIIPDTLNISKNADSAVNSLLEKFNATHAIVISSFDTYFSQTHVEVTKSYEGKKNREAFYDIVSDIGYMLYAKDTLLRKDKKMLRRFHSSRSVLSGLLAAGPNVVVQRKDAEQIAMDNIHKYISYYFPAEMRRNRVLFCGKGFEQVKAAIEKSDFEAALTESLRNTTNKKSKHVAMAYYNCAVLFEKKNQQDEAIINLRKSLSIYQLDAAALMMHDFEMNN
ncbi:MAG: hypothetical protein IPH18_04715 [Chitinophagaceae bacterium]|nr:hypothetical protein [Chitinophagaceae bacterium]MBK8953780.1 hypothetical protein [Chitinophagaceae bacterium]